MKRCSKLLCGILALSFVALTGSCGDKKANSSTDIQVYFWDSGYGHEFIMDAANKFNKIQDVYNVEVELESNAATIIKTLDMGKANTYDLYFTMLNTFRYNKDFSNLDDILDAKVYGESESIRSKYYSYLLDGLKSPDGTTRFLSYGNGWMGIVYNADMISDDRVPRTTEELNILTAEIAGEGEVAPWLFYNDIYNNGYWNYILMAWEAQYDGLDYYYNTTLALKDENNVSPSKNVLLQKDGRFKALEEAAKIITPDTVHKECTNKDFTTVQRLFLAGKSAMTINGSWLLNESSGSSNIKMMKTPVISSIVEKLENTDMDDETLSAIIKAVDEDLEWTAETKYNNVTVSKNDFEHIKSARNMMYNNSAEQYVFIPNYSPAKDGAKEFLKFFYSDEGTLSFLNALKIPTSVRLSDTSKFNVETLPTWSKIMFEFSDTLMGVTGRQSMSEVYLNSSTTQFAGLTFAQPLCAANPKDRRNAEQLWQLLVGRVNDNWNDWLP